MEMSSVSGVFFRAAQDCSRDEHELSAETNFYNCPKIFRNKELDEDNEGSRFLTPEDKFLGEFLMER